MGKTNILFVGRLDDRQKAVFMLPGIIEGLMERGNDIHLSIIGTGPDSKKLEVIIKNKNLKATISMVGLIDADKVSEYYQSHQIFVLPSNFEGLPLTLVEAMGNGCVPVVSNLPDSTDICVKDGINGFLVNIGDQNGFIDKIEVLIKNPRLLKKMSKECIELANNKFSLEQAHSCYLKVINELLSEKNQTRNIQIKQNRLLFKDWKEIIPFHLIMILKKGLHKIWK
jgi:glycosyltransferase involved in cell wall biosynthesis